MRRASIIHVSVYINFNSRRNYTDVEILQTSKSYVTNGIENISKRIRYYKKGCFSKAIYKL